MGKLTHHLYIDDSGQREYAKPGEGYEHHWLSRYFVFNGTLIGIPEAARLAAELAALKRAAFGSENVEVKSSWLRRQELREKRYLAPYGISEPALERFVSDFYDAAAAADLLLIASVVDKVLMTDRYGNDRWHTPTAAYEAIVQRLQGELGDRGTAKVFIDHLSGKTKAGNEYEDNLRKHHRKLVVEGSRIIQLPVTCLHSLPQFIDSGRSHLLQLSDLVAYNVLRQVRDHGNIWETDAAEADMYPWFRRLLGKFRQNARGKIEGYGVIPFPRP